MRARNIKPGFCGDKNLLKCSVEAHLLFSMLWMMADREGRLADDPEQIGLDSYFCFRKIDCDKPLKELADKGLILRYSVTGDKYIQIKNFVKHQNPHKNEATSEIPGPVESLPEDSSNYSSTRDDSLIPDSLIPDSSTSPSGDVCSELETTSEPAVVTIPLLDDSEYPITQSDIDEWQKAYPALDVLQRLRAIREWNLSNPKNRKTKRGVRSHITRWLDKDQNKARAAPGGQEPVTETSSDAFKQGYEAAKNGLSRDPPYEQETRRAEWLKGYDWRKHQEKERLVA